MLPIYQQVIKDAQDTTDESGNIVRAHPSAAMLTSARLFVREMLAATSKPPQPIADLRDAIARVFTDILDNGQIIPDMEGNLVRAVPSAAMLNAARVFAREMEDQLAAEPAGRKSGIADLRASFAERQKRGEIAGRIQPVDTEGDDAATG